MIASKRCSPGLGRSRTGEAPWPAATLRPILLATLVAGTLDILAAVGLTLYYGREPMNMLRYVASGPFPAATGWGDAGAALGLAVHFALMAVMAAVYVLAAARRPALRARPVQWGVLYGLATYVVMNLIVVPLALRRRSRRARARSSPSSSATSSWSASRSP